MWNESDNPYAAPLPHSSEPRGDRPADASLAGAIDALEALGFAVVQDGPGYVDLLRCRWHLDLVFTQVTAVVRVRHMERVDASIMESDRQDLIEVRKRKDPSMLPRGFQKGALTVATYIADSATPDAIEFAEQAPKAQFAATHISGIKHGEQITSYTGTRIWGAMYYGLLKFLVRTALDPKGEPESISKVGAVMSVMLGGYPARGPRHHPGRRPGMNRRRSTCRRSTTR